MSDITIRTEEDMMKKQAGVDLLKEVLAEEAQMEEQVKDRKLCPLCGRVQPLTEFHRDGRAKDKKSTYCKTCKSKRVRKPALKKRKPSAGEQKQALKAVAKPATLTILPEPVLVDFTNYPELLEVLARDAREDVRELSGQIVYVCKSYFQARQ